MSTRDRNAQPIRRTRSQLRRNIVLNVDLNAAPPAENRDQEETPIHVASGDTTDGLRGASLTPAAIDVEALDDDVLISSPRAFAAAKNNSRRNQGRVIVLDVDSGNRVLVVDQTGMIGMVSTGYVVRAVASERREDAELFQCLHTRRLLDDHENHGN